MTPQTVASIVLRTGADILSLHNIAEYSEHTITRAITNGSPTGTPIGILEALTIVDSRVSSEIPVLWHNIHTQTITYLSYADDGVSTPICESGQILSTTVIQGGRAKVVLKGLLQAANTVEKSKSGEWGSAGLTRYNKLHPVYNDFGHTSQNPIARTGVYRDLFQGRQVWVLQSGYEKFWFKPWKYDGRRLSRGEHFNKMVYEKNVTLTQKTLAPMSRFSQAILQPSRLFMATGVIGGLVSAAAFYALHDESARTWQNITTAGIGGTLASAAFQESLYLLSGKTWWISLPVAFAASVLMTQMVNTGATASKFATVA